MHTDSSVVLFLNREYAGNIEIVDAGVAEIVSVMEDFFENDKGTSYIFTSDHGMTNWGEVIFMYLSTFNLNYCTLLSIQGQSPPAREQYPVSLLPM